MNEEYPSKASPLSPRSGETIFRAFRLLSNSRGLVFFWIFIHILFYFFQFMLDSITPPIALIVVFGIAAGLFFVFLQAGFLGSLKEILQSGRWEPPEIMENGTRYFGRIFRLWLLIIAVMLVLGVVPGVIGLVIGSAGFFRLLIILLALITGVIVFFLVYSSSVLVAEDCPLKPAISASIRTVKKHFGATLVIVLVLGVLPAAVISLLQKVFNAAGTVFAVAGGILLQICSSYFGLLLMASLFLFYWRLTRSVPEKPFSPSTAGELRNRI